MFVNTVNLFVAVIPDEEEGAVARREKKRSRRSRSRDRDRERRRSRSRDRKRSKRSRSKERKFKIKEEEQQQGQWVGGDEDGLNGNQELNEEGFPESVRVKEEKADAYVGYGGDGQQRIDDEEEFEEGEAQ